MCAYAHGIAEITNQPYFRPIDLNSLLLEQDGFESGNLIRHHVAAQIAGLSFLEKRTYNKPFPLGDMSLIRAHLDAGHLVLIRTDSRPWQAGLSEHWVRLLSIEEEEKRAPWHLWQFYDPLYGEVRPDLNFGKPGHRADYMVWAAVFVGPAGAMGITRPPDWRAADGPRADRGFSAWLRYLLA